MKNEHPLAMPVIVLGCAARPGLVLPHLVAVSHTLVINPSHPLNGATMHPLYEKECPLQSHFNVFIGHREMARRLFKTRAPYGLLLEDDAVPNNPFWTGIVNEIGERFMGDTFDLMYLCGRCFNPTRVETVALVEPGDGKPIPIMRVRKDIEHDLADPQFGGHNHVFGSCAALWTRQFAERVADMEWPGIPNDAFFPDCAEFGFVPHTHSPFTHDHSQGSLIDPSVPAKYL